MRRKLLVALGSVVVLLVAAGSAGAGYAWYWDRSHADVIAAGVTVAGVPVGGLHADAAAAAVRRQVAAPLERPLRLVAGDWSLTLDRRTLGVRVDVGPMVGAAVTASRSGGIDDRVLRALQGSRLVLDVPLRASVSDEAVDGVVAAVSHQLGRPARSARVVPTATRLRIVPSRDGRAVDADAFRTALRAALLDPEAASLTVPTHVVRPKVPTAALGRRYPSFLLVDREHFKLRLYRHLKLVRTYSVAVGMQGLETPAGLYHINDREVDPPWHVPQSAWAGSLAGRTIPPGPSDPIKARWLGFYDGAGIHGTDETYSIGHAASHGCVRMAIPDVISLYPLVPLGTPIYVG
ncbi:MAG TPA: L,D-transpeptidase/peptidoglycan binding protein [Gaiellaceae bacterium]|nr:L,D-transpeptidase/peptidoglycan binding protein [Gaiellaceae bacterium]